MKAAKVDDQVIGDLLWSSKCFILLQGFKSVFVSFQLRGCSDLVQKLAEDRIQSSLALENTQKRLLDVRKSSLQLRETLEELQSKIDKSRVDLAELQIELEKER